MSEIRNAFKKARSEGRCALVVYLTAGYPDRESSLEYMLSCVKAGADVLEIGVPFTDPLADGPVIQATSAAALKNGMRPGNVLDLVKELRRSTKVPVVLMGYYNPIFQIGEAEFVKRAAESGVDGLIVADLSLEESKDLMKHCRKRQVDLIQLAAPTSGDERMRELAEATSGYLYLVSRLGTTGQSKEMSDDVELLIKRAKTAAGDMPVAVGFGISSPSHVKRLVEFGADGVIIGSSILKKVVEGDGPEKVASFVRGLREACK
ncbi:MAG: tryptophan synthase subunit alpha [Euryarchaeota archaeon]|nr:tryptophan synthase subunit alpha [Euryarchaeota archaeon]